MRLLIDFIGPAPGVGTCHGCRSARPELLSKTRMGHFYGDQPLSCHSLIATSTSCRASAEIWSSSGGRPASINPNVAYSVTPICFVGGHHTRTVVQSLPGETS